MPEQPSTGKVHLVVEPQDTALDIKVWVCCGCFTSAERILPVDDPMLTREHFIEDLGWAELPHGGVVCGRCKILPDLAHRLIADAVLHPRQARS